MSFENLGLNDQLLSALARVGYTQATPIQAQAIPAVLSGQDVLAAAQTGTGKTAGFTLPILQNLSLQTEHRGTRPRVLILTPTRELAAQVAQSIETYGANSSLRTTVIFGGVSANPQIKTLRRGVDILVATPGRLLDLAQQGMLHLTDVHTLVLDEADRMLDMGFIHDIKKIIARLPKQRQNLMFSATFSPEIRELAKQIVRNPVEIDVAPRNSAAQSVAQRMVRVGKNQKRELLSWLIGHNNWKQVLVFTRTKHGANRLCEQLVTDGLSGAAIHGNKSQNARTKALEDFKSGRIRILVATDIAARGIDIDQLPHVINYELPMVAEDYVHRIGRTGRAGHEGEALSLVCGEELKQLRDIQSLLKREIPVWNIEEFHIKEDTSTPADAVARTRQQRPPRQARAGGGAQRGSQNGDAARPARPAENRRRRSGAAARPSNGTRGANR